MVTLSVAAIVGILGSLDIGNWLLARVIIGIALLLDFYNFIMRD